ncbi:hypothetical protein B0H16DRAFT_1336119 [Mycena metata]|uniref:Uncharacterized protein n=1 Tax=Mycena metata TaxID=1033252 RepID=A0AAD7MJB9_9AGAR|nr:hypothetical protein B0H16DRAFT_1336119 [Mycena metata]
MPAGTDDDDDEPPIPGPSHPTPSYSTPLFVRAAVDALSGTSASYLTRNSPIKSLSSIPAFKPSTISPLKHHSRYAGLLNGPLLTEQERQFADALRESEARDEQRKASLIEVQAGAVLGGMWNKRAQVQLQTQETRKARRKGKGRMGDGKAKWFTGDDFFELAKKDALERAEETVGKEQRKVAREAHTVELAVWKRDNERVRERNEARKVTFDADTAAWEAEKEAAKAEKRKRGWEKPKRKEYNFETLLPRPKKVVEDDEEDGEGSDMDVDNAD